MSRNGMRKLPALSRETKMNVRTNITQRNLYSLWMNILLNKMHQAEAVMPSHDTKQCTISCSQWAQPEQLPTAEAEFLFLVSCLLVSARTGFWMHKWNLTVRLIQQWSPELAPISSRLCERIPKQWPNIHGRNFCICWPSFDVVTQRDKESSSFRYFGSDNIHQFKTSCWHFLQRYESLRLLWIHRLCLASKCAFVGSCGNDLSCCVIMLWFLMPFNAPLRTEIWNKKFRNILEINVLSHNCEMRPHRIVKNSCADKKQNSHEKQLHPGPFIFLVQDLIAKQDVNNIVAALLLWCSNSRNAKTKTGFCKTQQKKKVRWSNGFWGQIFHCPGANDLF